LAMPGRVDLLLPGRERAGALLGAGAIAIRPRRRASIPASQTTNRFSTIPGTSPACTWKNFTARPLRTARRGFDRWTSFPASSGRIRGHPRGAAVPAAGSRGVPPRSVPGSETLPELAGADACATLKRGRPRSCAKAGMRASQQTTHIVCFEKPSAGLTVGHLYPRTATYVSPSPRGEGWLVGPKLPSEGRGEGGRNTLPQE
jgi:hypothetical protein